MPVHTFCTIFIAPKMYKDMADKKMNEFAPATDSAYIYGETTNGSQVKIKKEDLAIVLRKLMPICYSGWTFSTKLKVTQGACCFILVTNGSVFLITTTGSKGASVSKLGGNANAEFREDSLGNVYVLSIGIYFIIQIGYNISNIIAEEINDFPSDSTSLVVS